MPEHLLKELVTYLRDARDLERLDLSLLTQGLDSARDPAVADIYRSHRSQTEGHLRLIEERLVTHGHTAPPTAECACAGALAIGLTERGRHTPSQLAVSALAFESLEIAVYQVLAHIAERAADDQTATVVHRILEEEEQAVELLAATLPRALALSLNESNAGRDS